MDVETKLRQKIREHIRFALEEISTTGDVAGYLTPYAFAGDGGSNAKRVKRMAKMIGYELTKQGKEDIKQVDLKEGSEKVVAGPADIDDKDEEREPEDTRTPQKKIADTVREIKKQIRAVEDDLNRCVKMKKEKGLANEDLWKMTQKQIVQLEDKLQKMIQRLRSMRA